MAFAGAGQGGTQQAGGQAAAAQERAADLAADEAEVAEPHTLFVKNLAFKTRAPLCPRLTHPRCPQPRCRTTGGSPLSLPASLEEKYPAHAHHAPQGAHKCAPFVRRWEACTPRHTPLASRVVYPLYLSVSTGVSVI